VIAGAMGLLIGLVWVVWNLIRPHMFG
jgi:hypothetical protein